MRDILKRLEALEHDRSDGEAQRLAEIGRLMRERARYLLGEEYERTHGLMSPEQDAWMGSLRAAVRDEGGRGA